VEQLMRAPAAASTARARGFTLPEALVVVFLIGLLSTMAVALVRVDDAARADREARRLAALIELAAVEARASGRGIAWSPESGGYAFWRRDENGDWTQFAEDSPFRPRAFGGTVALREVLVESRALAPGERVVFQPSGLHSALRISLRGGDSELVLRGGVLGRVSLQRVHAG
jgi:general secretion pathway protein H